MYTVRNTHNKISYIARIPSLYSVYNINGNNWKDKWPYFASYNMIIIVVI